MNRQVNVANPNILLVPSEPMRTVLNSRSATDRFQGNVFVVGAHSSDPGIASSYSNFGFPASISNDDSIVDLYAPGDNWTVLDPDGTTSTNSGTSFAAPTVSGVAALMLATDPSLRGQPAAINRRLHETSGFPPPAGVHVFTSWGAVSVLGETLDGDAAVRAGLGP
jgi:subtilisin family serine protease